MAESSQSDSRVGKPAQSQTITCPDWCILPAGHPFDGGIYRERIHEGPEFGIFRPTQGEADDKLSEPLGVDIRDAITFRDPADLREVARDALRAVEWLEAQAGDVLGAVAGAEERARADHESGACRDSEWSCSHCEAGKSMTAGKPTEPSNTATSVESPKPRPTPSCPPWCTDDSLHTPDAEDGTVWHSTAKVELMTTDGPIYISLERADGIADGSGGVLINLDHRDIRVDEARRLAAQLIAWADLAEEL